jgi:hypothetical protein
VRLSADISAISYDPLMPESIKLVIGAKNFSLLPVTEFFNRIGRTRKYGLILFEMLAADVLRPICDINTLS